MKSPFPVDQSALDPPLPECVTSPGAMSGFRPRRMPALRVACPASEGAAQRYRKPLWRPFKEDTS